MATVVVFVGVTGIGVDVLGFDLSAAAAESAAAPCDAWQIEYVVNATIVISDTMMGAGDGSYPNGPGKVVLRFDNVAGQPGGNVKLVDYQMKDSFTVVTHVLAWEARVKADTLSRTTPNPCGFSAEGVMDGRSVQWNGPWNGMRTDGSIICDGGLCGKFGAPPSGRSEMHIAPHPVSFKPLEYAPDWKTFTMASSIVSQQSSPSQTSRIALAGREVRRACVAVRTCP
jgi:hypothetical protein